MKLYAYMRVSTDQQAESGAGLAAQMDACQKWAQAHGIVISKIFTEEGISGAASLDKRPILLQAMSGLEKGDVLIVAKRDRLGRDPIAVAMIEVGVKRKNAKIISVAGEGTENDDPTSILMRRMVDAFSEFERNIIRGRTKAAMQAKKVRGERVGHIPFGYKLGLNGLIEENQEEQSILLQIKALIIQGLSTRKIATEMNLRGAFNRGESKWNHASIHRIMMKIAA